MQSEATVSSFDAELLARQLSQLGRDLQDEIKFLGSLEEATADSEGFYHSLREKHEDCLARAYLDAQGSVDTRKAEARLACIPSRQEMETAALDWNRMKGRLNTQRANLQALHRRVEIGRSLLSREKSLIALAGIGEL
jgi:hypothetical protein